MNTTINKTISTSLALLTTATIWAQTIVDDSRMDRDIQIAENVLSTMMKQQFSRRSFFPLEVNGKYMPGFGVTFRVPSDNVGLLLLPTPEVPMELNTYDVSSDGISITYSSSSDDMLAEPDAPEPPDARDDVRRSRDAHAKTAVGNGNQNKQVTKSYSGSKNGSYSYSNGTPKGNVYQKKINTSGANAKDSIRNAYNQKIINAAKDFIADYGDILSQLSPTEKIVITNRGEGQNMAWLAFGGDTKRSYLSIEGSKGDVTQYRQGKITREQLLAKVKVINSVTDDELKPDLELLSSIFGRLYNRDLSKTYFSDNNVYYERLKDYGAIYYMEVYSSNAVRGNEDLFIMPTQGDEEMDAETRNQKVKQLYPSFEESIKEDMLEYGHTLKSLKDEEVLTFNVKLTRCKGCEIPSTLELSIKMSALKDYASGKLTKDAAFEKFIIKKGPNQ